MMFNFTRFLFLKASLINKILIKMYNCRMWFKKPMELILIFEILLIIVVIITLYATLKHVDIIKININF